MKLKPSLFQLIVILMTVSLLASCTTSPEASQSNCDSQTAQQQSNNCDDDSGSRSTSRFGYINSGSRVSNSSKNSSSSNSKVGRSGFGSFGRGGHAGG